MSSLGRAVSAGVVLPSARRLRRALLALVGLGVSALCVYLITRSISLAQVRRSLSDADYAWLAPTLALTYATLYLRAVRWRLLFARPSSLTVWQSLGAVNVGLMFNNLLPWRAGEIPRALAARRASGLSTLEIGATIVVERMLDAVTVALAGLCLAPWLPDRPWIDALVIVCACVVGGSVLAVAALALLRRRLNELLPRLAGRLPLVREERAQRAVTALAEGSKILVRPRRLLEALALSLLVWGAAGLSGLTLLPAFGLGWSSLAPWLVLVANTLALTVPSSPGTIGLYEASVQASLVAFGVPASAALAYAIALHAVNFFPIILSGAAAAWLLARQSGTRPSPRQEFRLRHEISTSTSPARSNHPASSSRRM